MLTQRVYGLMLASESQAQFWRLMKNAFSNGIQIELELFGAIEDQKKIVWYLKLFEHLNLIAVSPLLLEGFFVANLSATVIILSISNKNRSI
jgi:hypothetical protein